MSKRPSNPVQKSFLKKFFNLYKRNELHESRVRGASQTPDKRYAASPTLGSAAPLRLNLHTAKLPAAPGGEIEVAGYKGLRTRTAWGSREQTML